MSQKKLSAVIYCVLLGFCLLAIGYLWGADQASADITVTVAPTQTEAQTPSIEEQPTQSQQVQADIININTADQQLLETLPGIGPALAGRILAYREQVGSFTAKEQLMDVEGIGQKRFETLAPLITVGGAQ